MANRNNPVGSFLASIFAGDGTPYQFDSAGTLGPQGSGRGNGDMGGGQGSQRSGGAQRQGQGRVRGTRTSVPVDENGEPLGTYTDAQGNGIKRPVVDPSQDGSWAAEVERRNRTAPAPTQRPNIVAPNNYQDEARRRQQALIDQLHGIATGQIESPAMALYKQSVADVQAQAVGNATTLRDVGPGGQRQIAQENQNNIAMQGMQGQGILQSQQASQAEALLAQLYNQQRAGDLSMAGIDASGILGNRSLNDLLGMGDANRAMSQDINDSNRRFATGAGMLGIQSGAITTGDKVGMAANGLGTAASYLAQSGAGNTYSQNQAQQGQVNGNSSQKLSDFYGDK